jgi:Domain of unknown function (DUF4136)
MGVWNERGRLWSAVLAAAVLFGAVPVAQKIEVESNYEPEANFEAIHTYRWLQSPPIKRDVAPGILKDPAEVTKELNPIIVRVADAALVARGLTPVASGEVDAELIYYLAVGTSFNASTIGEFYQYATGYALIVPFWATPTNYLKTYEDGSIVFDLIEDRRVIWRGSAMTHLNRDNSREKQQRRLEEAVRKIFDTFPVKKK